MISLEHEILCFQLCFDRRIGVSECFGGTDHCQRAPGARAVVSSLWKVDDRATQLFMERFYRNVVDGGMTVSEALQRSQIEMRSDPEYSAPFYWAAFVQHGDFRDRPQISRGSISGTLWLVIGVGSVLGALLFFMRRRIIARK